MLEGHFYHKRIKKAVITFGSIFNNIYVIRTNNTGAVISQMKVPLSYAPKRDFLDRLDKMHSENNDGERQIAVKLPRMSFEITSMNYDATRQLPKTNQCKILFDDTSSKKLYVPVPYNIGFDLSIYAKSQDDALQIIEQILPFFTPHYTVTINPFANNDLKEDTPISLNGISFSDDYEGLLEARRSIIYTLTFDMKINLYKDITTPSNIILQYDIDLLSLDGTELFATVSDVANVAFNTQGTISEGQVLTESNFKVRNVPRSTSNFIVSTAATNGTATVTFNSLTTIESGAYVANGTWTYTPNNDFYGTDSFVVSMVAGDSQYDFTINVTVTNVADAIADVITTNYETAVDFFVATNDTFAGAVTYSVASGGEASHGTVVVLNSATGEFRYTPDAGYSGSDSFIYRATPAVGTSETATVSITVNAP